MNRRLFLQSSLALAAPELLSAKPSKDLFYFAVIADSHIIDSFYKGPEKTPADTESILKANGRLVAARTLINSLPAIEQVFLVGDYFHNYPSPDLDFYFQNKTRIDIAKEITDGFHAPVHACFGNHDYAVPRVSREMSHELFRRKLNLKPYYSVDHAGWKFIHLNNFLGVTWQSGHAKFDKDLGSYGEEQINWFEAELEQKRPTWVFTHFPLQRDVATEVRDYGVQPLIKKHRDTIQMVISGHWHKWFDFGRTYGPRHLVIGATRYDENAYLIVEANRKTGAHRLLNIDLVDWNTHFSKPFTGKLG
ncbi:MAG: metallophosphoesterase [Bryobacteraceae bacterium]